MVDLRPIVTWITDTDPSRSNPKKCLLDGNGSLIVIGGGSLLHPRYGLGLEPYRGSRDETLTRGQEGFLFDRSVSGPFRCYEIYMETALTRR